MFFDPECPARGLGASLLGLVSTNGEQNFHGLLITYELYILVARRTAFGSVSKVEDYWKCFKEHFTYICSQRLQGISKYFLQFYSKCSSEGCKTIHNCCILMRWLGTSEATTAQSCILSTFCLIFSRQAQASKIFKIQKKCEKLHARLQGFLQKFADFIKKCL